MYASGLKTRDRGGALLAVALIHAGLLFAFLNLSGRLIPDKNDQNDMQIIAIEPIRPQAPDPERVRPEPDQAPEPEGAASAENLRSTATPVVAPKPEIELPRPNPVTTAPSPNQGADPTQGAAIRPGPGTGAGGSGTGTGAGGSGSGSGGGGGGIAARAGIVQDFPNGAYPPAIRQRWPRGGRIFVRLRIEADGRPSQCDVMRGFGDPASDQWTCSLLLQQGRFRPARNERGQPVADWYGYVREDARR